MICVPITASTTEEVKHTLTDAARVADLAEVRLDYCQQPDLAAILHNKPLPVIATNRPVREGGRYTGDESGRIAMLEEAGRLGADYIDIELDSVERLGDVGRAKRIVSYHNFDETPSDLGAILEAMKSRGADVAKLATQANDLVDNVRMLELVRSCDTPIIGVCMGELGVASRILTCKFGGLLTFATIRPGAESAPGQIPAAEMRDFYRVHQHGPDTQVYGVIGNPIGHSMSPAIFNESFKALDMDAVYLAFRVEDIGSFIDAYRRICVMGYSVTIPHKQSILPLMDRVDGLVQRIGAMNTVVNRDGKLEGYNTDLLAAVSGIEEAVRAQAGARGGEQPLAGKSALMLGAGGAGRGIAFGLKDRGVKLTIVNRTASKAERLAADVGCAWRPVDDLPQLTADILVNSTSVGMHPHEHACPAPVEMLRSGMVVFDAVYNPIETTLLRAAKAKGCTTVSGFDMFVKQAAAQFEIWFGRPAPVSVMAQVVRERLAGKDGDRR